MLLGRATVTVSEVWEMCVGPGVPRSNYDEVYVSCAVGRRLVRR